MGKLFLLSMCFFASNSYAAGQVEVELTSDITLGEQVIVKLISWHDNGYTRQIMTDVNTNVLFDDVPVAKFDVFVEIESEKSTAKAHGEVLDGEVSSITLHLE